MRPERRDYLAYLLRVWCTDTPQGPAWRASLESPHTGERQSFATLRALFTFLEATTRLAIPPTGTDTPDVDDPSKYTGPRGSVPSEKERHDVYP
jgi:hypothetical protein